MRRPNVLVFVLIWFIMTLARLASMLLDNHWVLGSVLSAALVNACICGAAYVLVRLLDAVRGRHSE